MNKFSEIITTEEQYEVAKAKCSIAFHTNQNIDLLTILVIRHFPSHSTKVR